MLGKQVRAGAIASAGPAAQRKGLRMLVLTRKANQSIMIGDDIEVSILSVVGEKIRVGIQAPQSVPVFRTEIYLEIKRQREEEDSEAPGEPKASQDGETDVHEQVERALRDLGKAP
jgi:carbon storage regulator